MHRLSRTGLVAAAILILASAAPLRAAPPFVTDDAGTQGAGNWQLELIAEHDHHSRSADPGTGLVHRLRQVTILNPVLTWGIADRVDVALGLNRVHQRTRQEAATLQDARGAGDSTLELKWRFYDSAGLSLALKPGVTLPTGDESRGLGTGRASRGLAFVLTREAKPWVWSANAAYTRVRYRFESDTRANHERLRRFSAGFTYAMAEAWRLAGEFGVRTNAAKDDPFLPGRNGSFAMAGAIYSPSEAFDLALGVRKSASRGETDWAFVAGAALRW